MIWSVILCSVSKAISNKLWKSHLLFRHIYFRVKMLVQSKLRSTFVRVFLLRVSPKPCLFLFASSQSKISPGKICPLFINFEKERDIKEIHNFAIFGLFCNKNIFYITKNTFLYHKEILFVSQKKVRSVHSLRLFNSGPVISAILWSFIVCLKIFQECCQNVNFTRSRPSSDNQI